MGTCIIHCFHLSESLFLRRRKLKCSGEMPSCKRCVYGGHGLDCEYPSERGNKTQVQFLETSIAKLEARIEQLRNSLPQPTLEIHVPGRGGLAATCTSNSPIRCLPATRVRPQISLPHGWWEQPKLPPEVSKLLMDYFAPYAFQLGFFMHGPRLCEDLFKQSEFPSLSPFLSNVIYLWGIRLSSEQQLLDHETLFLNRAVQFNLSNQHPQHVVHNVQAEILLANFFLWTDKINSAMHRLISAVSLCISFGLHKQASSQPPGALSLPPARDSIERGERIDAFWATFLFYKVVSVQVQVPPRASTIMDDMINTPFPYEMSAYELGSVPSNPTGILTLKSFFDNPSADPSRGLLALSAKSAAFFERAMYFGVECQSVQGNPDQDIQFRRFEQMLIDFINAFPPLSQWDGPYAKCSWIATTTIIHVAVIRLHSSQKHIDSSQKSLNAAQAVARAVASLIASMDELKGLYYIHPITMPMWFTVCHTLITGIQERVDFNDDLVESLHTMIRALESFSSGCFPLRYQLEQIHEIIRTLHGLCPYMQPS
ncbi:hypothetical protein BDP27DRAFT_1331068 [Rhodocollybia butyracea]|uniref:Transcription factor domain-containing protein n=1 Tax=Rhodocollybia butyracea TaxID=206335 RepID=A0A9P5PIQ3_9AGAR|nr:hypothetical protein BDP27DRAFT_1331068 [Rhodocollybia butyracea]